MVGEWDVTSGGGGDGFSSLSRKRNQNRTLVANTRTLVHSLRRRKMGAVFNCPKKDVVPMFSTLCSRQGRLGRVLIHRRRKTARTTRNFTHMSNRINIYLIADKPNTAGAVANVTSTVVSDAPVIIVTNRMKAGFLNASTFRRISLMNVARPVAG